MCRSKYPVEPVEVLRGIFFINELYSPFEYEGREACE